MPREFMCSSHTISGVMPGGPRAARHPLGARLAACAAAGYAGMWLHVRDYLEQRAAGHSDAELRDLFDRNGLRRRGVEFLSGWREENDADALARENAALAAASAIGADILNVGGDFERRGVPRREAIRRFARLCARAADRGLRVALEFVPWSDVPDLAAALDFMAPANAGLVVDVWHVCRGGISFDQVAKLPPERVLCVQVNDATALPEASLPEDTQRRRFCGEGALDLRGFDAALARARIHAPLSVEIISRDVAALPLDIVARKSFDAARPIFDPDPRKLR